MKNGSLESLTTNGFEYWAITNTANDANGTKVDNACSVITGTTIGGNSSNMLLIDATAENGVTTNSASYLQQKITGIVPGVRYKISADVYIKSIAAHEATGSELNQSLKGPQINFRYFMYRKGESSHFASDMRVNIKKADVDADESINYNEWCTIEDYIVFPEEADAFSVHFRLQGLGKVYFDNLSIKICDELTLETNEWFYYSDLTEGTATATLAPKKEDNYDSVQFILVDGNGTAVASSEVYDVKNPQASNDIEYEHKSDGSRVLTWHFNPQVLSTKGTAYTLKAVLTRTNSTVKECSETVYRYDRPTLMNAQGQIFINNQVFIPRLVYHVYSSQYAEIAAAGFNVVQSNMSGNTSYTQMLDKAQAAGIKVVFVLYRNYLSAADESNIENTMQTINEVKNHPATLGYMVMDEPTSHMTHRNDKCKNEMIYAYKTIRELDPNHPIFNVQAEYFYPEIKMVEKCSDVLMIDPYPMYNSKDAGYQGYAMDIAGKAVEGSTKPVLSILQTFATSNTITGNQKVFPTIDNYKNCYYRSLFAGAGGIGIYPFRDAETGGTNTPLSNYELWDGMLEFHGANGEASIFDYAFLTDKSKQICHYEGVNVIAQTVRGTDGKIYLAVINATAYDKDKGTIYQQGTADISLSLTDILGENATGSYTATLKYGVDTNNNSDITVGSNDTLNLTMNFEQVLVFEISQ